MRGDWKVLNDLPFSKKRWRKVYFFMKEEIRPIQIKLGALNKALIFYFSLSGIFLFSCSLYAFLQFAEKGRGSKVNLELAQQAELGRILRPTSSLELG